MSRTALQSGYVKAKNADVRLSLVPSEVNSESIGKGRQIWWSNAIFFIAFHIVGLSGWYYWPSSWRTWFLCYINWQLGTLGITIGKVLL